MSQKHLTPIGTWSTTQEQGSLIALLAMKDPLHYVQHPLHFHDILFKQW